MEGEDLVPAEQTRQSHWPFSPRDIGINCFCHLRSLIFSHRGLKAVKTENKVVVAGLGEVGKPLFELISTHHDTIGVDISPPLEKIGQVEVLHVCYPFQIKDFVGETVRYIEMFKPKVTIVNSTVAVGTTRLIAERSGVVVVSSPKYKHARMLEELCMYTKFVGAIDPAGARRR